MVNMMKKKTLTRKENYIEMPCRVPSYKCHQVMERSVSFNDIAEDTAERINWAESILGIPSVWSVTQGEGVKVAVLDTGIDSDHPDLAEAIVGGRDFTGDGIEDVNGHGTHCAGIVGARMNDIGFIGVAPKADLLIGKVIGSASGRERV